LVRTCYRENVRVIPEGQLILNNLLQRYNYGIVHTTTGEIPYIRFQRAIREKRSLFREFRIMPPFLSSKDIFCLRVDRMVDSYRKVSINNLVPVKTGIRIKGACCTTTRPVCVRTRTGREDTTSDHTR
jgi:hypothetical protein